MFQVYKSNHQKPIHCHTVFPISFDCSFNALDARIYYRLFSIRNWQWLTLVVLRLFCWKIRKVQIFKNQNFMIILMITKLSKIYIFLLNIPNTFEILIRNYQIWNFRFSGLILNALIFFFEIPTFWIFWNKVWNQPFYERESTVNKEVNRSHSFFVKVPSKRVS